MTYIFKIALIIPAISWQIYSSDAEALGWNISSRTSSMSNQSAIPEDEINKRLENARKAIKQEEKIQKIRDGFTGLLAPELGRDKTTLY